MVSKRSFRTDLRYLDELAGRQSPVHGLHPLAHLLTALAFLIAVTSCARDAISQLLPFLLYPVLLFTLGDLPVKPIMMRVLLAEPLLVGIGLLNPLFDRQPWLAGNLQIAHGWLVLAAIIFKGSLTVTAALLLIAVTGMVRIASALSLLRFPRLLVTVLLLIYRYIAVLTGETARTGRAYSLRAPGHPGVRFTAWGSLAGQLLLRSLDRSERIYQAMVLRGYNGTFPAGAPGRLTWIDGAWFISWTAFFIAARLHNLPLLLGTLVTGA